jgi:serine/threonine-protein kinase HipA
MADFEVHVDLEGQALPVGLARSNRVRGGETILFEYDDRWLARSDHFSLEPALRLTRGVFAPPAGLPTFGSIGDSAPHSWGRRLMQRAERRRARREGRAVRTLTESDYLLGVADETRLGALRFRHVGGTDFLAPVHDGVPALIELERLLRITQRILRDEETDEDLRMIFAPGSSLGGARPKASVIDRTGRLSIAKFPEDTDAYSIETWEEIALRLARRAGVATPHHELIEVAGKAVLLSRRFDRSGAARIPFLSAMAMIGAKDGERGSYPELVDALAEHGAQGKTDAQALYRRVVFNVLISNVDDHLRNHGFLWIGNAGWSLSPAYDLNPVPIDLKERVLTTNIDLDEGTCSIELLEAASAYYALTVGQARAIIKEVAHVTALCGGTWRGRSGHVPPKSPAWRAPSSIPNSNRRWRCEARPVERRGSAMDRRRGKRPMARGKSVTAEYPAGGARRRWRSGTPKTSRRPRAQVISPAPPCRSPRPMRV